MSVKKYTKQELLEIASLYHLIDIPEEGRKGVLKIVNPVHWSVILFDLSEYAGHTVTVKFSAEVKREGTTGSIHWQINNNGSYPSVGRSVSGAKQGIWHKTGGQWRGKLTTEAPVLYLTTWRNEAERTTYYIDNISLEVTGEN